MAGLFASSRLNSVSAVDSGRKCSHGSSRVPSVLLTRPMTAQPRRQLRASSNARRRAGCCAAFDDLHNGQGWSEDSLLGVEADFYTILGIPPNAPPREVKRAYHSLMREYHPDALSGAGLEGVSTEFAALLNEIYETLSNPEQRDIYDAMAGFSLSSVNPFTDTSYPADRVFVDEVSCIGCGKCVRACPSSFVLENSKYGRARVYAQPGPTEEDAEEINIAIETCPVDTIHWVTAPQLSLLETALSRMDRVDAFLMLRNCRSGGNVFEEASIAWRKRQSNIAARLREQEERVHTPNTGWQFWKSATAHVDMRGGAAEGSEPGGRSSDGRSSGRGGRRTDEQRIADLAASAARAARLWRLHREVTQRQHALTG